MAKTCYHTIEKVRQPAVAGSFYPAEPSVLRGMIEGFLYEVEPVHRPAPKAIIAPHAGYVYSGPIAASAYAQFAAARDTTRRIVLLGPSHYVPFRGLAATEAASWTTPLGVLPVDVEAIREICALPQVNVLDTAPTREHSLEVQLPFLQIVFNHISIVPLAVGDASDVEVAEVIDALWGGEETRFVVSSDLSHFHGYREALELDAATARAVEQNRPESIGFEQACGCIAIRGFLRTARKHGLRAHTLDLRNSGDTYGPRSEVVGYGAFAFEEE